MPQKLMPVNKVRKVVAILPARMAATRFPNKPLAQIMGLSMIEHVRRRVEMSAVVDEVIVATCDEVIREHVEGFGGRVIMTSDTHERCTDRVAEAAEGTGADIIVNVQGDEPLIMPSMIDEVVRPLLDDRSLPSSNLVVKVADDEEFQSPNAPKAVKDLKDNLLYISREAIPSRSKAPGDDYLKLKQLGIIAFTAEFLRTFAALEPTPLEIVESVDMMRAVEHGYKVRLVETKGVLIGVDVPGDVARVERVLENDPLVKEYLDAT